MPTVESLATFMNPLGDPSIATYPEFLDSTLFSPLFKGALAGVVVRPQQVGMHFGCHLDSLAPPSDVGQGAGVQKRGYPHAQAVEGSNACGLV
jgi:hypothetical protein